MGGDLLGRRLPPVLLGPGTPPAVGTVSTRQLVAFARRLVRAAEASSAVLPTLVPTRTAVLTSGGQIRCGCGRRARALRRGRWGHLPVLPGESTFAAFAAKLGRALLGPFTEGRRGPLSVFSQGFLP